jgi:hypothetical protein
VVVAGTRSFSLSLFRISSFIIPNITKIQVTGMMRSRKVALQTMRVYFAHFNDCAIVDASSLPRERILSIHFWPIFFLNVSNNAKTRAEEAQAKNIKQRENETEKRQGKRIDREAFEYVCCMHNFYLKEIGKTNCMYTVSNCEKKATKGIFLYLILWNSR